MTEELNNNLPGFVRTTTVGSDERKRFSRASRDPCHIPDQSLPSFFNTLESGDVYIGRQRVEREIAVFWGAELKATRKVRLPMLLHMLELWCLARSHDVSTPGGRREATNDGREKKKEKKKLVTRYFGDEMTAYRGR